MKSCIMAALQFVVSPPTKELGPRRISKTIEEKPKLILAPFKPPPEVKFDEVIINSKATRILIIYNPSTVTFTGQFGNIEPEERIFVNESEIKVQPQNEKQVFITWSPVRTGYLRKIIRLHDTSKKAKSFEITLRGMAVNLNQSKSNKRKMFKADNKVSCSMQTKNLDSTVTLNRQTNQKGNENLHSIRRETYTIEEKENQLPNKLYNFKNVFDHNFPVYQKNFNNLNTVIKNSAVTNFPIQSQQPCDNVDAPIKYSNFEFELSLNANTSSEMNPFIRRSTLSVYLMNEPQKDINLSTSKFDHAFNYKNLSSEFKDEHEQKMNLSVPQNYDPCDSLDDYNSAEIKTENVTFDMKNYEENIFLTPQKCVNLDSLIMSPSSTLTDIPMSVSKSTNYLHTIDKSPESNFCFNTYKTSDLFFISPPRNTFKHFRKSSEELFPHRTGSSAISDRKKHLRTSFMPRKKTSPNSNNKIQGIRRIFNFHTENSIEKVQSRNPQTLKQAVTSHCNIDDPFLKQLLYNDDKWLDRQERDIIKWMNLVLSPPTELNEENTDWTVDAADVWLKRYHLDESSSTLITNKVPLLYSMPQTLDILRKRKISVISNEPVYSVFKKLSILIEKKIISIREDRDLHADEGLKNKLFQLLSCYNPQWLRIGLEAIYDKEISLQRRADVGGLGLFIRKYFLNIPINKKNINYKDVVKKVILLKFLKLIYFMDQARLQKLIRYSPCLFILKSKYKSSQEILSTFCADLVIGRSYVMKHLKSIDYVLRFKQTCVDEYDYNVKTLDDLKDGIRLTRLCEILFMETDLCSKLRVPAIDIENKKHNVEVAMNATKCKFQIEGNITSEDIVIGNRAGSRMKTLSFLWQIIYNYLTPLYEKAAVRIQKWWRKCKLRTYLKNFITQKKNELVLKRSVIIIQQKFRAVREMKLERKQYLNILQAILFIQRRFRANKLAKLERNKYLQLKKVTLFIKCKYKANQCMKIQRNQFLILKKNVIIIQQKFRALQNMKKERRLYLSIFQATLFIQRKFRANLVSKQKRNEYLQLRNTVILVQRKFREIRDTKIQKHQNIILENNIIKIQQRFRANRAMKIERNRYLNILRAVVFIQRKFKAKLVAKIERNLYCTLKKATLYIQQRFRANKLRNIQKHEYMKLKTCVIFIQQKFRSFKRMQLERKLYLLLLKVTIFIQQKFRANRIAKFQRNQYLTLRNTTIFIQQKFKAIRNMKKEKNAYLITLKTIIFIQRKFRANRITKFERNQYLNLKKTIIFVQEKFRAIRSMKQEKKRYLTLLRTVIFIQRKFRANLLVKSEQNRSSALKDVLTVEDNAAIKIQAIWRGYNFRKKNPLPKKSSNSFKKEKENPDSKITLGERYIKAIYQLKTSDLYNVITIALWNLETVTTFSAKLCEGVARERVVPIIFNIISRGNRSEPSIELYRASFSILINLARYLPTRIILWDTMNRTEDVLEILRIMKITHDKFVRKNDIEVFQNSATFLWLLCQDKAIAKFITNVVTVHQQIQKMLINLKRKCNCNKILKTKKINKILPKTEADWYADPATRTFNDNCFAVTSIYSVLFDN